MNVKLSCPSCGQHYDVDLEPGVKYQDMDCRNCGGRIPVSFPVAPDAVRLQCPICKHVFVPPFDLKTHIGGTNCPECGSGLPLPLEKNIVGQAIDDETASEPTGSRFKAHPAAYVFFALSLIWFTVGEIAAIWDNPALSNALYWAGVSFILTAIFIKIPAK